MGPIYLSWRRYWLVVGGVLVGLTSVAEVACGTLSIIGGARGRALASTLAVGGLAGGVAVRSRIADRTCCCFGARGAASGRNGFAYDLTLVAVGLAGTFLCTDSAGSQLGVTWKVAAETCGGVVCGIIVSVRQGWVHARGRAIG